MKYSSFFMLLLLSLPTYSLETKPTYCKILVVEKGTDWPVPLVQFRTTHHQLFVTDNAGVIVLNSPELLNRETWFHVEGHGYGVRKDGFGFEGVRITPKLGKTIKIEVERRIIAQRLGRLTGAGLFTEKKITESGIVGCDSVQVARHGKRLYWLWGDTSVLRYPLGIFNSSCATTSLTPLASRKPPLYIAYDYFKDKKKNEPRGVANIPGKGPTWISAMVSVPDKHGKAQLVASYMKVKPPLTAYERGLCLWNEKTQTFERFKNIWTKTETDSKAPLMPDGHASFWADEKGERWLLFGNPLPKLRCRANFESWQNPKAWEKLTPQRTLEDASGGKPVKPHTGSITWHPQRKRWITVFMQAFGKPSVFGELWYAEAKSPFGPWGKAVKILSHNNYTFYNPRIHPELAEENSSIIYFEGTYTTLFADKPHPTPRYDYNQILYQLDLNDKRLTPAQKH